MIFIFQSFGGFGFGDGSFQVSIGIGAFPFNLFVSAFNFTTSQHASGTSTSEYTICKHFYHTSKPPLHITAKKFNYILHSQANWSLLGIIIDMWLGGHGQIGWYLLNFSTWELKVQAITVCFYWHWLHIMLQNCFMVEN